MALACAAIVGVLVHRATGERVHRHGRDAFSSFLWRVYDWRVWPLNRLR